MDIKTLKEAAEQKMKGFCHLCPICDGRACTGEVPGMGGAITSSSFKNNYKALAEVKLNMRLIHDATEQDISYDFFGVKLSAPIMNGPIGGLAYNCGPYDDYQFQEALMRGMTDAGLLGWIGDPCKLDEYANSCKALQKAGRGVAIIKPHTNLASIRLRFEQAKAAGAIAFGMDIDGAGIPILSKMGFPVGPKSLAQLKEIRAFMPESPFIIKGIMTPDDALRCVQAGVSCIVVSNHGGRVLDGTPGVAEVLPAIKRAVGNDIVILADGAVRSGVDVLKYIALGADAVLIGRPVCWGVYGGEAEGVQFICDTYAHQLKQAMLLTGCKTLKDIDWRVLYHK